VFDGKRSCAAMLGRDGRRGMARKSDDGGAGGEGDVETGAGRSGKLPTDVELPTFPENLVDVRAFVEAGLDGAQLWVDYFEDHPKLKTMNAYTLFMRVFFANAAGRSLPRRDARRHFEPLSPYQADRKIKELQEDGFIKIVKSGQETGLILSQEVADLIIQSSQISMENYAKFFLRQDR